MPIKSWLRGLRKRRRAKQASRQRDVDPHLGVVRLEPRLVLDAPGLTSVEPFDATYTEGDAPVPVSSTIEVVDDDALVAEATVQIADGDYQAGQDVLALAAADLPAGVTASFDASTGTLSLMGDASLADYQAALRAVTFENTSSTPREGSREILFQVTDTAADGGATSQVVTRSIQVQGVGDPPALGDIEPGNLAYTENDGPRTITSTLTVNDPNGIVRGATVRISSGYRAGEDRLAVSGLPEGVTSQWNDQTGTLTITGEATDAQYQDILRSVTYENLSDNPSDATRRIEFHVSDGSAESNALRRDIDVSPVNDAPVIHAEDFVVFESMDDNTEVYTVRATDVDADPSDLRYSIASSSVNNAFNIDDRTGVISVRDTNVIDFDNVQQITLTVEVRDRGNSGDGGEQFATHTFTIDVIDDADEFLVIAGGDVTLRVVPEIPADPNAEPDPALANLVATSADGTVLNQKLLADVRYVRVDLSPAPPQDSLILDFSGGNPIPDLGIFLEGGQNDDGLEIRNVPAGLAVDTVTYSISRPGEGRLELDFDGDGTADSTVVYRGVEQIDDTFAPQNRVFTYLAGQETITVSNAVPAGQTRIVSSEGPAVTFNHPTTSLTIRTSDGSGADAIDIEGLDTAYDANLTIIADSVLGQEDQVRFTDAITDLGSGSLSVDAHRIEILDRVVTDGGSLSLRATDDILVGAGGRLIAMGAGDVTVQADADQRADGSGGSLRMENGAIIDAGDGGLELLADEDITIDSVFTTGLARMTTTSGEIREDGDASVDLTAGSVALRSARGIGGANPLETQVATLAFQNTLSGDVGIDNTGPLDVNEVDGLTTAFNAGGAVSLAASSPVTFSINTSAALDLVAQALESGGPNDDVRVLAGVTVESTGGDVIFEAGDDIEIAATATVQALAGVVRIESGVGDMDDVGSMTLDGAVTAGNRIVLDVRDEGGATQAATGSLVAPQLLLRGTNPASAGSFALATSGLNDVNTLAADIDGALNLRDDDGLTVGTVMGVQGITTSDDDVTIDASNAPAGGIVVNESITTAGSGTTGGVTLSGDVEVNASLTAAGGSLVLLAAAAATGDVILNATVSSSTTITISAPRDILVNGSLTTTPSGATIQLTADNDATGVGGVRIATAGAVNSAGDATIRGSDLFATALGDPDSVVIEADGMNWQIDAAGSIQVGDGTAAPTDARTIVDGRLRTTGSGATITITAEDDVLFGAGGDVQGVDGSVTVTADTGGAGTGVVTMDDDTLINAGSGLIDVDAAGDITLGGLLTTGEVRVTSGMGAIVDGGDTFANIDAGSAALRAATGIGGGNPLETSLGNLAFNNSTSGNVDIANVGGLTVTTVDGLPTSDNPGGAVTLGADGPITFAVNTTAAGTLIAMASESASTDTENITLNAGVTVSSSGADVVFEAGDRIIIAATAAVLANGSGGDIVIESGLGDTDDDGQMTLDGTLQAADRITLNLNEEGGALQAASGTIDANELLLLSSNGSSAGSFSLATSGSNDVSTLAADIDGSLDFRDDTGLTVGMVGTFLGITTRDDNVTIDASNTPGGLITISQAISTADSGVGGGITLSGALTIDDTLTTGGGDIVLRGGAGATADIAINAEISSTGTVDASAPRDILVGAAVSASESGADVFLVGDDDDSGTGGVRIATAGSVTAADQVMLSGSDLAVTAMGDPDSVVIQDDGTNVQVSAGGMISITDAAGAPTDARTLIDGRVQVTGSGASITITAEDDVVFGVNGDVTGVDGPIIVTADTGGAASGAIQMADGAVIDAGSGTIDLNAAGDITLGRLVTTSSSGTAITIDSIAGGLLDGGDAGGADLDANNGTAVVTTATGIGAASPVETRLGTLDATVTASGGIQIIEADALVLSDVDTADGPINVTAGGQLTATDVASLTDNDANDISLTTSAGDILVGAIDAGAAGDVTLDAAGAIADNNGLVLNVTADVLTADAGGAIELDTTIKTLDASTTAAGNIDIDETNAIALNNVDTSAGNILIDAGGLLEATNVSAVGGGVLLVTSGGNDIVANNVSATANGVSGGNAIKLDTAGDVIVNGPLTATAAADLNIDIDPVNVAVNAAITATGDITITAGNDVTVAIVTVRADSDSSGAGTLTITADDASDADGAGDLTAADGSTLRGAVVTLDGWNVTTGTVTADVGDVTITANQQVTLNAATTATVADVVVNATDVTVNGSVTAGTDVMLTAATDAAVNNTVTAADDITITAGNDVTIAIVTVRADSDSSGAGTLTITADDASDADGAGDLTAADGSTLRGAVVTLDGWNVTTGTVTADVGDVTITANQQVTLNAVTTATVADVVVTAATGDVNLSANVAAGANVDIEATAGSIVQAGGSNVLAGGDVSLDAATMVDLNGTIGSTTAIGGDVLINTNLAGTIAVDGNITADGAVVLGRADLTGGAITIGAAMVAVTITSDADTAGAEDITIRSAGNVTQSTAGSLLAANTGGILVRSASGAVTLVGADSDGANQLASEASDNPGTAAIVIRGAGNVTAAGINSVGGGGNIELVSDSGNVALGDVNAGAGSIYIQAASGAIIDNNAAGLNLAGAGAALRASAGIGGGNDLETALGELAAVNSSTGAIEIDNASATLAIGTVGTLSGVSNAGPTGLVWITNAGALTVDEAVINSAGGDILLAAENAAGTENLLLNANVTASGGTGNIRLVADDAITLASSVTVSAASSGQVLLQAGVNYADGTPVNGSGGADVVMNAGSSIRSDEGDIVVQATGDVRVRLITADSDMNGSIGDVTITADFDGIDGLAGDGLGEIIDENGDGPVNVIADHLLAEAGEAITLDTTVVRLRASNETGAIDFDETDAIVLVEVVAGNGSIRVDAAGEIVATYVDSSATDNDANDIHLTATPPTGASGNIVLGRVDAGTSGDVFVSTSDADATTQNNIFAAASLAGPVADDIVTSITVHDAGVFPDTPGFQVAVGGELMTVTGISGNTFTVTRGQGGTTASAHLAGTPVRLATQLMVAAGPGAASLNVTDASAFPASGNYFVRVGGEILQVTAVSGNTLSVVPGAAGSPTALHAAGSLVLLEVAEITADQASLNAVNIGTITSFAQGTGTPIRLELSGDLAQAWANEAGGNTQLHIEVQGNLAAAPGAIVLNDMAVGIGIIRATGDVDVSDGGEADAIVLDDDDSVGFEAGDTLTLDDGGLNVENGSVRIGGNVIVDDSAMPSLLSGLIVAEDLTIRVGQAGSLTSFTTETETLSMEVGAGKVKVSNSAADAMGSLEVLSIDSGGDVELVELVGALGDPMGDSPSVRLADGATLTLQAQTAIGSELNPFGFRATRLDATAIEEDIYLASSPQMGSPPVVVDLAALGDGDIQLVQGQTGGMATVALRLGVITALDEMVVISNKIGDIQDDDSDDPDLMDVQAETLVLVARDNIGPAAAGGAIDTDVDELAARVIGGVVAIDNQDGDDNSVVTLWKGTPSADAMLGGAAEIDGIEIYDPMTNMLVGRLPSSKPDTIPTLILDDAEVAPMSGDSEFEATMGDADGVGYTYVMDWCVPEPGETCDPNALDGDEVSTPNAPLDGQFTVLFGNSYLSAPIIETPNVFRVSLTIRAADGIQLRDDASGLTQREDMAGELVLVSEDTRVVEDTIDEFASPAVIEPSPLPPPEVGLFLFAGVDTVTVEAPLLTLTPQTLEQSSAQAGAGEEAERVYVLRIVLADGSETPGKIVSEDVVQQLEQKIRNLPNDRYRLYLRREDQTEELVREFEIRDGRIRDREIQLDEGEKEKDEDQDEGAEGQGERQPADGQLPPAEGQAPEASGDGEAEPGETPGELERPVPAAGERPGAQSEDELELNASGNSPAAGAAVAGLAASRLSGTAGRPTHRPRDDWDRQVDAALRQDRPRAWSRAGRLWKRVRGRS